MPCYCSCASADRPTDDATDGSARPRRNGRASEYAPDTPDARASRGRRSDFHRTSNRPYQTQRRQPHDRIFDISPNTVTRRMRAAAEAAGIDPTNITSHSPRVGMAQDLAASGIPMPGLMQAGRWKTAATATRYTEHLSAHDTAVGQYLKTRATGPLPMTVT